MSPQVEKYCLQAVINYLGGDIKKFKEYVNKAMLLNENLPCGHELDKEECKYGHKGHYIDAIICLKCGQIIAGGKVIRQVNHIC